MREREGRMGEWGRRDRGGETREGRCRGTKGLMGIEGSCVII